MLRELNQASLEVGLSMNLKKTKVMYNEFAEDVEEPTTIDSRTLHLTVNASPWIPIRRNMRSNVVSPSDGELSVERVQSSKTDILIFLKRQVYDKCILSTLTYGSETWNPMKQQTLKLRTMQRSHKRIRLKQLTDPRKKTKVRDIMETISKLKLNLAGHVVRREEN